MDHKRYLYLAKRSKADELSTAMAWEKMNSGMSADFVMAALYLGLHSKYTL